MQEMAVESSSVKTPDSMSDMEQDEINASNTKDERPSSSTNF